MKKFELNKSRRLEYVLYNTSILLIILLFNLPISNKILFILMGSIFLVRGALNLKNKESIGNYIFSSLKVLREYEDRKIGENKNSKRRSDIVFDIFMGITFLILGIKSNSFNSVKTNDLFSIKQVIIFGIASILIVNIAIIYKNKKVDRF